MRKKFKKSAQNETQQPRKTKPIRDDRKSAQKWTFLQGRNGSTG
ncbi:hypothetical protein AC93_3970 [Escherichia coli 2-005-03_S4_C2]|nr:hypothetical protein AD23_4104 [Escherichia coli 2-005-03_S4_C3]EZJ48312.1 hypothetical protein AC93_3970 [Escherichia coli 2-005-03_S4_C2]KDT25236.1 hypothetical protein AC67_4159 [Escherichia coli 2-052-05_S4_C1]